MNRKALLVLAMAAAFGAAGCTLGGDDGAGDTSYWMGTLTTGKPKSIAISNYSGWGTAGQPGVRKEGYGQVKLYPQKMTLAKLDTEEALIGSGGEYEPMSGIGSAAVKKFPLYIDKGENEWKTTGDYYVYFFYKIAASEAELETEVPKIYEYYSVVKFAETAPDQFLSFSSLSLMVPPVEKVP